MRFSADYSLIRLYPISMKHRRITIQPTSVDRLVERAIARHAHPLPERVSQIITWGADEHILVGLAIGGWLLTREGRDVQRRTGDHLLLTTVAASVLPHVLKGIFRQKRPDRCTVGGHMRGIPFSGREYDAFPSGHAIHIGALASAATRLPPKQRVAVWSVGAALIVTRVVLLAHWVSDVAAGLAIGAVLERGLRPIFRYGQMADTEGGDG
jgi:undecaprenyl-diphosphatase